MKKLCLFLLCVLIAMSGMVFTGCSGGWDGEVNVYNWGEYISNGDDDTLDVIAEFERTYNIKVNYTNFETNEELYNVLVNSNSSYDVIIPSDYMVERLRSEGLLEKLDFSNIPNYENIDEQFRVNDFDPTGEYTVPYTWGIVALVYNTTMIEEGAITGFKDMWNPEYKNSVLMFNNSRDAMAIAMQMCDPPIDPGAASFTEEDIDRATRKLIELKSCGSLKKYVMDQVFTEMEGSQSALAAYYGGDIYTMLDNNEDLDYCLPEEGSNLFIDCMCIPTCCQNKENAELFINFMCDAEIAAANADYICYGTPNKAALELMDDDYKESPLCNPPQEYIDKCYTFTNIDDQVYAAMQEKFVKACSSTAEVSSVEVKTTSTESKVAVAVILGVILIATIVVIIFDIRKAIKNRGRINKV